MWSIVVCEQKLDVRTISLVDNRLGRGQIQEGGGGAHHWKLRLIEMWQLFFDVSLDMLKQLGRTRTDGTWYCYFLSMSAHALAWLS